MRDECLNVPIYRAKKIDGDEYVSGYLKFTKYNNRTEYVINYVYDSSSVFGECEIDPTTLAIHFPGDMIDSKGNKLFASLSKDGKGGDVVEYMLERGKKAISVCRYNDKQIVYAQSDVKVIGIQE